MASKVIIPNTFATATTAIPLSQLDSNFLNVNSAINNALTYSNYAIDIGAPDVYAITVSGLTTTYAAGLSFQFIASNTNTGASTLNVNGQGAQSIVRQDGTALSAGDIVANGVASVIYDGTNFQLLNYASIQSKTFSTITVTDTTTTANLSVSGNTTISSGLANSVAYLDSSKKLATSNVFVHDGTNVGIGTLTPTTKLYVSGGGVSGSTITVESTANSGASVPGIVFNRTTTTPSILQYAGYIAFNRKLSDGTTNTAASILVTGSNNVASSSATIYYDVQTTHTWKISGADKMYLTSTGLGIKTSSPTANLDVNADIVRLRTSKTPATAGDTGNQGDICWDSNYVYVCVATNTWKRATLSTW